MTSLTPRDFRAQARMLQTDLAVMLEQHPDTFDCLVYMAQAGKDETVAVELDVVGSIESGERAQTYSDPVPARAMLIPDDAQAFGMLANGLTENFYGAEQPLRLLLSISGVRKYSLVQWLEYPSPDTEGAEEAELQTVYVQSLQPTGHTMGAGVIHICLPLPALGEIPSATSEPDPTELTELTELGTKTDSTDAGWEDDTTERDSLDPVGVL